MKKVLALASLALLVAAFVPSTTVAASTSYVLVYENPNDSGDHWQIDRYADGNVPDMRNEFIGLAGGYCEGVHSPDYQDKSWNNCVDSGTVHLDRGECVRIYSGLYSGVISTYAATGSGTGQTWYSPNLGHDSMSSLRWGNWDYYNATCKLV